MRLRLFFLCMFFMFSTTCAFADSINGFDNFSWKTRRNEIIAARGDMSVLWGETEVWKAKEGEKVGDFSIRLIGYDFENGCTADKETVTDPCSLWGGFYVLETTSPADINKLISLLGKKYGRHKTAHETLEKKSPRTNELLANIEITTYKWEQADKSSVELQYKGYDRDYAENKDEFKKGLFVVGVKYCSSEYNIHDEMKNRKRDQLNEKTF